jgi:hypothetical protein
VRRIGIVMALVGLVILPCVAGAQDGSAGRIRSEADTGSRIRIKPVAEDPARVGHMIKGVARCVYQGNGRKADKLLATSDTGSLSGKEFGFRSSGQDDAFGISECMSYQTTGTELKLQLRFSLPRIRAMMAEEAYLKRFSSPPALPAGAAEDAQRAFFSTGKDLLRARGLAAFADCVVFKNTAAADAVLRTPPGTMEERTAAKGLAPVLGPCLVQGQEIALTPIAIRAIVADGLWARYVATNAAVAAK